MSHLVEITIRSTKSQKNVKRRLEIVKTHSNHIRRYLETSFVYILSQKGKNQAFPVWKFFKDFHEHFQFIQNLKIPGKIR